jgi:hypothetical protein
MFEIDAEAATVDGLFVFWPGNDIVDATRIFYFALRLKGYKNCCLVSLAQFIAYNGRCQAKSFGR